MWKQKQLNADIKATKKIEFFAQLKKLDVTSNATHAVNEQCMFVLTILEKIKETRLQFSQGIVTVL